MDRGISRRSLLAVGASLAVLPFASRGGSAQSQLQFPVPDTNNLRSGDLVWPKKRGDYVAYHSGASGDYTTEKSAWEIERDAYVALQQSTGSLDPDEERQVDALSRMDFREFIAIYQANEVPGVPGLYSGRGGGGLYVGHVGIIDIDDAGMPWVVEALWKDGVVRNTYSDWLAGRPDVLVWHGRLKGIDPADGSALALEARKHVGKPYRFWNFDLDDDSGFYCSKLVWLSAYRALGIAVDDNSRAKRGFWFSPKQLLYVPRMNRLHDPGQYRDT